MHKNGSGSPGRPRKYPWDEWWKKRSLVLKKGRDFKITLHGMCQAVRNRATIDGYKVSVKMSPPNTLTITRM